MASNPHTPMPRITRVFAAVNIGSFRISAMVMGQSEDGEMIVLGSSHRKSEGIKRGYVTDMAAAMQAIRAAVEQAESSIAKLGKSFCLPNFCTTFARNFTKRHLIINVLKATDSPPLNIHRQHPGVQ